MQKTKKFVKDLTKLFYRFFTDDLEFISVFAISNKHKAGAYFWAF